MNRILLYILFLGTLYGCSIDNAPTPITPEEEADGMGYSVSFSSNMSYDINTESRAGVLEGSNLPDGIVAGIYALKTIWKEIDGEKKVQPITSRKWNKKNLQYDFKNEPYKTQGNAGRLISTNGSIGRFPSYDNTALQIYAYYPYSPDIVYHPEDTEPDAPKIKVIINNHANLTEDYLYTGTVDAYPTGEPTTVNLPFKHALARLKFKMFTNDVSFTDTRYHKLTRIKLTTNNYQDGYMNIETGEIRTTDGNKNVLEYELPEPYKILANNDNTQTGIEFLLIPNPNAINEIILYVEDENGNEQPYTAYSYYPKKNDPKELKAGFVYTVNVEYRSRASFECGITGWKEDIVNDDDFDIDEDNDMENENFVGVE